MQRIWRIGAAAAATAVLLAPALWNRFPLLEYDSGGYLARWFEGTLVVSRSTTYALFAALLAHPDLWPIVIVQAAVAVWVLALTLRALGFDDRPGVLLGITVVLGALTTLPWIAGIVLTDIFAGLAVLALYLLMFAPDRLNAFERTALVLLVGFAVSTHGATIAVGLALVAAAAMAHRRWRIGAPAGIAWSTAALGLGALLLLSANYLVARRLAWTPGGASLAFGRMLQDGIVSRYLADHCAERHLKLCAYRRELPTNADVFFWSDDKSVFNRLGRFAGLGDEMESIVFDSLRAYPLWQIEAALVATARQLVSVASGEGVEKEMWHTHAIIERYEPSSAAHMHAARQQRGELSFTALNRIHVPVALLSMALLLPMIGVALRRKGAADLGLLAATVAIALLANAAVCGVLSNPHDRYGARLAWLPPLVVLIAALRLAERRQRVAAGLAASRLAVAARAPVLGAEGPGGGALP